MKIQEVCSNEGIEIIDIGESTTHFNFPKLNMMLTVNISELAIDEPRSYLSTDLTDRVLVECKIEQASYFLIYILNKQVYVLIENRDKHLENNSAKYPNPISIKNYFDCLQVRQIGLNRLEIFDKEGSVYTIENFLNIKELDETIPYEVNSNEENVHDVVSIINHDRQYIIVSYSIKKCTINLFKVKVEALIDHKDIRITLKNRDTFQIENLHTNLSVDVNYRKLKSDEPKRIFKKADATNFHEGNMIALYKIKNTRLYIYNKANSIFIVINNAIHATGCEANLKIFKTRKNFYFFGKLTHRATNSFGVYDYLYLVADRDRIAKFTRPFAQIKFFRKYGFFKVSIDNLIAKGKIHQGLLIGNKDRSLIYRFRFTYEDESIAPQTKAPSTKTFKKIGKELLVIRTTSVGDIFRTLMPHADEYFLINQIKIFIAYHFAKISLKRKKINLYFEKKSAKADESAFRVFEQISKVESNNSLNYFILDKNSDQFMYMKNKYQSKLVKKHSFKHYLYIFKADYFIATELSTHVINDRLYINSLYDKIMQVPLIFLQHGIMFAKPVDNPMALGFHKGRNCYKYKTVISSKLEAKEFYKMGYTDEDLILTGLATFDFAKSLPTANKIVYMPTWRYWEERLILGENIRESTYYKSINNVIKAFEKSGMLNDLLIATHNKFTEFIYNSMPQYRHIMAKSPTEALAVSKIFITDYSSAIYDAQYRGAYPIFYWEEKDHLIKNYKAIPPVNEENAPGPIAMNLDELINLIEYAKANDYIVEDEYKEKFLKICEFDDNRNTNRIVEFLKSDGIL